jgi:hypothetical protein
MVSQWPKVAESQALTVHDLVPADKLRETALSNINRILGKAQKSELTEAKLVLYDDGHGVVEPAYHFIVNRTFNLGEASREASASMIPYDFYLPVYNKSRAEFPDMQEVRVLPLDGRDDKLGNVGEDE